MKQHLGVKDRYTYILLVCGKVVAITIKSYVVHMYIFSVTVVSLVLCKTKTESCVVVLLNKFPLPMFDMNTHFGTR